MKKLFVSVPMKGRTEENIRKSITKMHKIAEAIIGEELELIESYVEDNPPKPAQESVWYLSKSIEKLATADVFITVRDNYEWNGCYIETVVAQRYLEIPVFCIEEQYVMDDWEEIRKKMYEEMAVPCNVRA